MRCSAFAVTRNVEASDVAPEYSINDGIIAVFIKIDWVGSQKWPYNSIFAHLDFLNLANSSISRTDISIEMAAQAP